MDLTISPFFKMTVLRQYNLKCDTDTNDKESHTAALANFFR